MISISTKYVEVKRQSACPNPKTSNVKHVKVGYKIHLKNQTAQDHKVVVTTHLISERIVVRERLPSYNTMMKKQTEKKIRNPDQKKTAFNSSSGKNYRKTAAIHQPVCVKRKPENLGQEKRKTRHIAAFTTPEKHPCQPCQTSWAEGSGECWARHHPGRW